jgi:hypothetical protein
MQSTANLNYWFILWETPRAFMRYKTHSEEADAGEKQRRRSDMCGV